MVVIVILGILAAVGIPKLFGSIAKAKASEIPVAAGSYVRLQDVYLGEKTVLGSWGSIGYNAPGNGATDNFTYGGDCFNETDTKELQQGALGWKATSKVSLNDCPAQSSWGIMLSAGKEKSGRIPETSGRAKRSPGCKRGIYIMHRPTCSKEEHDRLKEAWDNEKAKCKELYGNAVCGE